MVQFAAVQYQAAPTQYFVQTSGPVSPSVPMQPGQYPPAGQYQGATGQLPSPGQRPVCQYPVSETATLLNNGEPSPPPQYQEKAQF